MKKMSVRLVSLFLVLALFISVSPISSFSSEKIIRRGKCGDKVEWELYDNGTLLIFGYGKMWHIHKCYIYICGDRSP